ncbi:glycoside hydrolase [Parasedimentitalea maritima]|uniref:Glycoside hydrolase n=1 Tax=Parasedimentitalea maritima TaxID=2578117 RepID=A0ABY2V0M1_9RHOB|nr:GH25 family lysozyme [Zongyanglinia marina]TLP69099.1 glycoside hydrolase [Zongyanglinia marina]
MRKVIFLIIAVSILVSCGRRVEPELVQAGPASTGTAVAQLVTYPQFGDSDPYDWERRKPTSYPIHGIDVSRWQGDINWRQARSAGVSFAYIKATEGGDVADPKFDSYWRASRQAGVPRGAYHYFYFCRPAAQQARWFIKHVPREANALPHVLDMEWTPHSPTCTKRPDGAHIRREATLFLSMLEAHYGRRPVIYTTVDFYQDTGIGRLSGTEFWLRSVAGHPAQVYPGASWNFWQYSGTGRVPGVEGDVDVNVFRGSPESWLQWSGQSLQ